jgi:maltooligosyltrehalose trehalohydrolase
MLLGETDHLTSSPSPKIVGATPLSSGGWRFCVWAPAISSVELHLNTPTDRLLPMSKDADGFHSVEIAVLPADSTYLYRLDGAEQWPDPASRSQPQGVHGPSQIVDARAFEWKINAWRPLELASAVLYELHVGTYTPEGTFDGVISHLDELAELGITTIEIMPVAQFPGSRNWGYDGVYIFAPQNTYGGPHGLQRVVDAAHQRNLTVVLDVVYNHLGPEGNYAGKYGPYFTDRYRTPWGSALNFDGRNSAPVRDFFISNALYWLEEYRFDGLRLDAIDGIRDFGAKHFLAELQVAVAGLMARTGRKLVLIAESDMNDRRVLDPPERGGYALDTQWSDDFHHSVHTLLTGETSGYYADFGTLQHLAGTLRDGWFYQGQASKFRGRKHGNSPRGISPEHFVVCSQNHDQVGNRARAERLSALVDMDGLKLAAGITLLSPFVPMLFMGEEYGETAPFQYFTSHEDAGLIDAVRKGRRKEFAAFGWHNEVPDPQSTETFISSRLKHDLKGPEPHLSLRAFYKRLLSLRRTFQLGKPSETEITVHESVAALLITRKSSAGVLAMLFHFGAQPVEITPLLVPGEWRVLLDSRTFPQNDSPSRWSAPFTVHPRSFVVFEEGNFTPEK